MNNVLDLDVIMPLPIMFNGVIRKGLSMHYIEYECYEMIYTCVYNCIECAIVSYPNPKQGLLFICLIDDENQKSYKYIILII